MLPRQEVGGRGRVERRRGLAPGQGGRHPTTSASGAYWRGTGSRSDVGGGRGVGFQPVGHIGHATPQAVAAPLGPPQRRARCPGRDGGHRARRAGA